MCHGNLDMAWRWALGVWCEHDTHALRERDWNGMSWLASTNQNYLGLICLEKRSFGWVTKGGCLALVGKRNLEGSYLAPIGKRHLECNNPDTTWKEREIACSCMWHEGTPRFERVSSAGWLWQLHNHHHPGLLIQIPVFEFKIQIWSIVYKSLLHCWKI